MWHPFKRLMTFLLLILAVWYALESDLIQNYLLPQVNEFLTTEENAETPVKHSFIIRNPIEAPEDVDKALIQNTIFQLTNDLRQEQGAEPLTRNDALIQVADLRAVENETSFSHTRPDNTPFYTALESRYDYQRAGENLAMGTYHGTNEEMATFLFDGWVESQGHYENMIEPLFSEIGIGVHYDGEMLYLVQIFGTPR